MPPHRELLNYLKYWMRIFFLILLVAFTQTFAQNKPKSEAFKKNPFLRNPVFKPKYRSYPLVAGYLLVKDAKSGDPFAEHELGLRYLLGKGFPKDTAKAIFWIKKAADQKLTTANFNYGIMLLNGIGVEWNPFEAFKRFEYAAKSGMPEAQYIYATFYIDNLVVSRNYKIAYYWLKKSAEKNVKQAKELLARMKENGIVFDDSEKESETQTDSVGVWNYNYNPQTELLSSNFELSFYDFNNEPAQAKRGEKIKKLLRQNPTELAHKLGLVNYDSAEVASHPLKTVIETAGYGSPNAYKFLGKLYEYGIGVKCDTVIAVLNYLRALRLGSVGVSSELLKLTQSEKFYKKLKSEINKNNFNAYYVLSALTALNFSFEVSKKEALQLLKKAAEGGNVPSLIELGLAYFNGSKVKRNPTMAQEYWNIAAKKGNREAKVRIAFASVLFAPEKKNLSDEVSFLKNASEKGSVPALDALGFLYEKGIGVRKNKSKAAEYYRKALFLGNRKSYDALRALYDEIRPSDKIFRIDDVSL